jgi:hypothetical protein
MKRFMRPIQASALTFWQAPLLSPVGPTHAMAGDTLTLVYLHASLSLHETFRLGISVSICTHLHKEEHISVVTIGQA